MQSLSPYSLELEFEACKENCEIKIKLDYQDEIPWKLSLSMMNPPVEFIPGQLFLFSMQHRGQVWTLVSVYFHLYLTSLGTLGKPLAFVSSSANGCVNGCFAGWLCNIIGWISHKMLSTMPTKFQ